VWSAVQPARCTRGERVQVPIKQGAGSASKPTWMLLQREKSLSPAENRTVIFRSVTPYPSLYTDFLFYVLLRSQQIRFIVHCADYQYLIFRRFFNTFILLKIAKCLSLFRVAAVYFPVFLCA
jgi:hypothetical protein